MAGVSLRDIRKYFQRAFPERQFYYRSQGTVRYLSLSGRMQVAICFVLFVLCGWVAFSSVQVLWRDDLIASMDSEIREVRVSRDRLASELEATRMRFIGTAGDLEQKHRQLVELVRHKENLEKRLALLSTQVESVSTQHRSALGEVNRLRGELENERGELVEKIGNLEGSLTTTIDKQSTLEQSLIRTRGQLAFVQAERDALLTSSGSLAGQLEQVVDRLGNVRREQQDFMDRILARTERAITNLEATVAMTGLRTDSLLNQAKGTGGPFIDLPLSKAKASIAPLRVKGEVGFPDSLTTLEERLNRWEGLQELITVMPLSAPMDVYEVSSGFGARRDPFTKGLAMHAGLDFIGTNGSTILATGPGKVSFAGRNGAYGKMIEIDHGFGLSTRYAHLDKIGVEVGQIIEFRQEIGRMGSTGRSTGPHLHYEILFDGKAHDPELFLKAGKYVFKK